MKTPTAAAALSMLALFACTAADGATISFSAELVDTQREQTRTGSFHYHSGSYRFEVVENGQTLFVMVDGATGTMRLVNPAERAYHEAKTGEPLGLFADPFAFYAHYAREKEVRTEGNESIGGVPCRKQVVSAGEQVFVIGWVADEFALPLKVHVPLTGRTVELRNLQRGPQDPARFVLPPDFRLVKVEVPAEPQPEWAGRVAGAPLLTPPFERAMAEGEIVRLRPQAGRWVAIEGHNTGQVQGAFTTASFKGGKYSGGGSMSTVILDPGDSSAMDIGAKPETTDEVVVRVGQGSMTIKASFVAPPRPEPGAARSAVETARAEAMSEPAAELSAPGTVAVAERIEVSWIGPGNRDDFISIARPNQAPGAYLERTLVREGNPLKVWSPSDPGTYEVRYVVGRGARLLARIPLEVAGVTAGVDAAGPVDAAAWIEVKWEGPAREGDYISLARADQVPGASVSRASVKDGNPLKVRAASDPGEYEVRYVLARGNRLLAKAPVTIAPVTAEIRAPAAAMAGTELVVPWQGPGYPEDFVSVARADQPPAAHLNFISVRKGNPAKLRAPKEPGTYEVRYVLGRGSRLLARASITVKGP